MRILLVTHYYPPEVGAPQRRWQGFVEHWAQSGIDVTVVCPLPHYPEGTLRPGFWPALLRPETGAFGERVIRVPFVPKARSAGAKLADHAVAAAASVPAAVLRSVDLVLTSAPGLPSLVAGELLARMRRVPHIVEMRDAWPDLLHQADLPGGRAARVLTRLVQGAQRRADHLVTVSGRFADVLRRRYPEVPVEHISNGISVDRVPELPSRPLGGRPLQILYLGTMGVSQGLDHVVEAAALAGPEVVELTMAGGGAQNLHLQELARKMGVSARFLPQVSGAELWSTYAAADTVVVPLRDWPAFEHTVPSKLYEIFATGKHISAMLSGEAKAIVEEARAGVCVPPENGQELAERWIEMHASGTRLGHEPEVSREWVLANADYRVLSRRYIDVFSEVLAKRGTA